MKGSSNKRGGITVSLLDKAQKEMNAKQAQERMQHNLRKAREDDDEERSVASDRSLRSNRSFSAAEEAGSSVAASGGKKRGAKTMENGSAKKGGKQKRFISESFLADMDLSVIHEEPDDQSGAVSEGDLDIVRAVGGRVGRHVFEAEALSYQTEMRESPTQIDTQDPFSNHDDGEIDSDSEVGSGDGTFDPSDFAYDESEVDVDRDASPLRYTIRSMESDMFCSLADISVDSQSLVPLLLDHSTCSAAGEHQTEAQKKKDLEKRWSYDQKLDGGVHDDKEPLPDELVGMYRTLVENGGKAQKDTYAKNLFTTLSCHIMDAICTSGKQLKEHAQYIACEKAFQDLRKSFPKMEYAKRMLFYMFEDNKWPACFEDYCTKLYADPKEVGVKWATNNSGNQSYSEDEKIQLYIGYKIKEAWKDTKRDIQKYLAPKWKPPHTLASGWSEEGFLRMLRRSLFKGVCWERAKASESTNTSRGNSSKKGKGGNKATAESEATGNEPVDSEPASVEPLTREMRAEKSLEKMLTTYDWYPNYWMAFVMYGQPAKGKMLLSLNGGSAELATIDPTQDPSNATTSTGSTSRSSAEARSPNAQLAKAGKQSKSGRQAIRDGDKMAASVQRSNSDLETTAVSTVTSVPHEAVEIKHIHVHEVKGSAMQDLRTQIELQSDLVDRLKAKADKNPAYSAQAEEEEDVLMQMYLKVKNLK